jgi:hypothetical protein
MDCIAYKKGYKYQIVEEYTTNIPIKPTIDLISPSGFISLTTTGQLTLKKGYAWDGPSGPTIDTLNFMRGSLVHDALYQLMRERLLDHEIDRDGADRLLQQMCKEDGMWALRAWWVYIGLKYFGDPASDPSNKKEIAVAPSI